MILFYGLQHNRPHNYLEKGEREIRRGDKNKGSGRWYWDEAFLAVCIHYLHYMILVVVANPKDLQVLGLHQEQGNLVGDNLNLNLNTSQCDNWNPNADRYRCDFVDCLTYPYPFTPTGAFWPFKAKYIPSLIQDLGFSGFSDVTVWKRPMICPPNAEGISPLLHENFDFRCPMAQQQPWIGNRHQWYWICGTDWDNGDNGATSHIEYILVVWGICLFGLNLFAQGELQFWTEHANTNPRATSLLLPTNPL